MAKIINVEKSSYLQENMETFTSNKVNQYSKFLNMNPIFCTYMQINEKMSRYDVGTGGIDSAIGPNSPIRFNQINGLPVFNIPELKPEIIFDEKNGYDVELDITDVAVPPNTIIPKTGDYIIITIPNSVQVVFRINAFGYNTIQSNDFYLFSGDLTYAGKENQLDRFRPQIVEVYETIFDNIGTQDKCFIRSTDVDKIKNIGLLINELLDLYKTNFFDSLTGSFVSKQNTENIDPNMTDSWYYDKYVNRFIMESEIYFNQNGTSTVALPPQDIKEMSDQNYIRTIYHAVLKQNTALMGRFPYAFQTGIDMLTSAFRVYDINCRTARLHITSYPLLDGHSDGLDSEYLYQYLPFPFIHSILDQDSYDDLIEHKYDPHDCWKQHIGEEDTNDYQRGLAENQFDSVFQSKDSKNTSTIQTGVRTKTIQPDADECSCGDLRGTFRPCDPPTEDPKPIEPPEESYQFTDLDNIIIAYLLHKPYQIERGKVLPYAIQCSNFTYKMMPMIIFILVQYYNSYFKEEKIMDL